jgi:hypothetical protein
MPSPPEPLLLGTSAKIPTTPFNVHIIIIMHEIFERLGGLVCCRKIEGSDEQTLFGQSKFIVSSFSSWFIF